MKIWAHTLVKNEERYLWFAVTSIIDYVDKLLLWDTGSSDKTVQIAKELKNRFPSKIEFREIGIVDINEFTLVRQDMLKKTIGDWIILVDGDEVWWDESIKKLTDIIHKDGSLWDSIACRFYNLVGDIFHYQDESAGKYSIDGKVGHLTVRAINNNIKGLHFGKPHGQQGIFDANNILIQNLPKKRRHFIDEHTYLHFTHLPRSSENFDKEVPKRNMKLKFEIGKSFPLDFFYPEAFFRTRADIVPSPWLNQNTNMKIKSYIQTPIRKFKRRILMSGSGY